MAGLGDPCRLVGISPSAISRNNYDNKKWRLPTNDEHATVTCNPTTGWASGYDYNGKLVTMTVNGVQSTIFYPAAGHIYDNGTGAPQTTDGYYMSSTNNGSSGCRYFSFSEQWFNAINYNAPNHGFTVRCVPQKLILS